MPGGLAPGTVLAGTYHVVRLLGQGGMGNVYEVRHHRLAGRYAVKVLATQGESKELFARFRREAEITSALRHPNIVNVLDYNVTGEGRPYLVMEYLEGIELTHEMARLGAMPVERVIDIVGQIASALSAAHALKVVHRDLKPQNLYLLRMPGEDRDLVKVMDFGISKVRESSSTKLTQEQMVIGTPQYMSPEQALGRIADIDDRTDQFALGAITYEMLTGRSAFRGSSAPSLLYQIVHEHPEPLGPLDGGEGLEAVVLRALAKRKEDRFASVKDFHRELVRVAEAAPRGGAERLAAVTTLSARTRPAITTHGASTGEVRAVSRSKGGRGLVRGAAALAVVAVLGVAALGLWEVRSPSAVPAVVERPPPAAPPPRARVRIEVTDVPPGLRASLDGTPVQLPLEMPAPSGPHQLLFEAPGYEPHTERLEGATSRTVSLAAMKPISRPEDELARKRGPVPGRVRRAALRPKTAPPPPVQAPRPKRDRLLMDL